MNVCRHVVFSLNFLLIYKRKDMVFLLNKIRLGPQVSHLPAQMRNNELKPL